MQSKYRTRCLECGNTIYPGDEIEKRNDKWVHQTCPTTNQYGDNRSSGRKSGKRWKPSDSFGRNAPAVTLADAVAQAEGKGESGDAQIVVPAVKDNFVPSPYQQAIFDFITNGTGNGVVEAVAGSGKTTTLERSLNLIPSNKKVIFLAFNKHIVTELKRRNLPPHVEVVSVHALGYRLCRALGSRMDDNRDKLGELMEDFWPISKKRFTATSGHDGIEVDSKTRAINRSKRSVMRKLVSISKATLLDYHDRDAVLQVADRYGIELDGDEKEYLDKLSGLIDASLEWTDLIDYDDMIWFPVVHPRLKRHLGDKYDFIMVDEAQDLNASQIELILSVLAENGRIIAVGDRHQSLYGFRGADVEAIPRLIKMLNAKTLPLSISYRCPRSHVMKAKELVPQIESHESAKEGSITSLDYDKLVKAVQVGDMVLCRTNAPLVEPAFAVIRSGKKAIIRGKDIGKTIVTFIERFDTDDLGTLEILMAEYTEKECQRLLDRGKELQADALLDKMQTVMAVAKECKNVYELTTKIMTLFDDRNEGVVFSSVHRAKGLEANMVYILREELMPHPKAKQDWEQEQEKNVRYVAITRSKDTLCFVQGG